MALSIFEKADPDLQKQKDAETALRTRRRDRDALNEKLGIAEAAIANYRAKARALAADGGDDKAISAAEASKRSSEDRVATLIGAVADVDAAIIKLEAQIAAIVDRRCRIETSATVNSMADRFARAQKELDEAAAEFAAAAQEAGLINPAAAAMCEYTTKLRADYKPASAAVVDELNKHAQGVLSGHLPAGLPRPTPPPVVLKVVPAEPTTNIFVRRNLKYVAANGTIVTLGRNKRHDVPKHLAELALSSDLTLPISDPRCRALEQSAAPYTPIEQSCEWLGPPGKEAGPIFMRPGGAVVHSQFQPVDRGQPYTVMVPRQEPIAMGARSLPEGSDET